jgi:hypothetical protein
MNDETQKEYMPRDIWSAIDAILDRIASIEAKLEGVVCVRLEDVKRMGAI